MTKHLNYLCSSFAESLKAEQSTVFALNYKNRHIKVKYVFHLNSQNFEFHNKTLNFVVKKNVNIAVFKSLNY